MPEMGDDYKYHCPNENIDVLFKAGAVSTRETTIPEGAIIAEKIIHSQSPQQ